MILSGRATRSFTRIDLEDPIEVTYDWDEAFPDKPTGRHNPEILSLMYSHGHDGAIVNGVSRIGHMRGGTTALWNDETMADEFVKQTRRYLASQSKDKPFFLYFSSAPSFRLSRSRTAL